VTTLVLLDIDGTLLTAFGEGRAAYYETLEEIFPNIEFPMLDLAGRTDFGIWCELTGLAEGEEWERFRSGYAHNMDRRLAARPPKLLPGVESLLEALVVDDRFEPGIVTGNLEHGSRVKIRHAGLEPWLSQVPGAYGDRVRDKDDLAAQVADARRQADAAGFRLVVVGDTVADLRCARGAGAACLGVLTGGGSASDLAEAEAVVPDLSDTVAILEILDRIAR